MKKGKRQRSPLKEDKAVLLTKYISQNNKYSGFKYNSVLYQIGDCMMINDKNRHYSIAQLLKVIPQGGKKKYNWPCIKVKWFYYRNEINRKLNGLSDSKKYNCISKNELFTSNEIDIILIEKIICKCYVIPIETYMKLSQPSSNYIYYTRARYNVDTELIEPPFKEWETICICNTPFNSNQKYLICEKCKKYYHSQCLERDINTPLSLSLNKEKEKDAFYCNDCKGNLFTGNSEDSLTKEI